MNTEQREKLVQIVGEERVKNKNFTGAYLTGARYTFLAYPRRGGRVERIMTNYRHSFTAGGILCWRTLTIVDFVCTDYARLIECGHGSNACPECAPDNRPVSERLADLAAAKAIAKGCAE